MFAHVDLGKKLSPTNHDPKLVLHSRKGLVFPVQGSRGAVRVRREKNVGMENCVMHARGKFLCLENRILSLRIMMEKRSE